MKVRANIKACFDKAMHEHTDQEGYLYYIELSHALTFIVAKDGCIVTIYGTDYGFGETVNRTIVQEQLKVIRRLKRGVEKAKKKVASESGRVEAKLGTLNAKIEKLYQELSALEAAKTDTEAKLNSLLGTVTKQEERLHAERCKLFKRAI